LQLRDQSHHSLSSVECSIHARRYVYTHTHIRTYTYCRVCRSIAVQTRCMYAWLDACIDVIQLMTGQAVVLSGLLLCHGERMYVHLYIHLSFVFVRLRHTFIVHIHTRTDGRMCFSNECGRRLCLCRRCILPNFRLVPAPLHSLPTPSLPDLPAH